MSKTKAQIEQFPSLDDKVLEDKLAFEDYDKSYRSSWASEAATTRKPVRSVRLANFEIVRNRTTICEPRIRKIGSQKPTVLSAEHPSVSSRRERPVGCSRIIAKFALSIRLLRTESARPALVTLRTGTASQPSSQELHLSIAAAFEFRLRACPLPRPTSRQPA